MFYFDFTILYFFIFFMSFFVYLILIFKNDKCSDFLGLFLQIQ